MSASEKLRALGDIWGSEDEGVTYEQVGRSAETVRLALLPLEVHWLCRKHHHDLHQWKRRGAPTSQIFLFWQDRVLWQHRNLGKVPARAVKRGTIVRFKGEWGVLESGRFCSWEGPAFRLRPDELVEVLVERKKKKR